jgi:multiple sugar transport system permease protein
MTTRLSSGAVGRGLGDRVILAVTVALAIAMVLPTLWAVGLSLKTNAELLVDTNSVLKAPWTLQNYYDILIGSGVFRWLLNSIIQANDRPAAEGSGASAVP